MDNYNLHTLIHRNYDKPIPLPDGSKLTYPCSRDIPIRIPKIQRDYAEGRDSESIARKRRNLLNDMIDVLYGVKNDLPFDFIYGYMVDGGKILKNKEWQDEVNYPTPYFEPLDGQQRLTTLFLLYWLFGRGSDLQSKKDGHALLIYETRDTSEEFCNWLVKQNSEGISTGWMTEVSNIKKQNNANRKKWKEEKDSEGQSDPIANRLKFPLKPVPSLFQYFQSIESFKWDWHDDPNILSMIKVLESALVCMQERALKYKDGVKSNSNLDRISFMLLDNLVCDGDLLFEKMNARGKPLTSFEILKSSIEEEMERQGLGKSDLINNWRKAIDGDWIDFCWDNSNIGKKPKLEKVRSVEKKLESLLIRMAGKSFFMKDIKGTTPTENNAIDYKDRLINSISDSKEVDNVMERYFEYARHERSLCSKDLTILDFQCIYDDLQNLIFKDAFGRWKDASMWIPQINSSSDNTLLDEFIKKPTHNIRVMIYAMLSYLRIVPAKNLAVNDIERSNFIDWMRFIRNVYNADNKNSGLDDFSDVQASLSAIDEWLKEYKKTYRKGAEHDVLRLIVGYIKDHPFSQEKARLDEEYEKAKLRLEGTPNVSSFEWEKSLLKAEDNHYLWGQIVAPLSWAIHGSCYNKDLFDKYVECFNKAFTTNISKGDTIDAMLIQTMLCYGDYRHNRKDNLGSLGTLTQHRDHSWKQYLRKSIDEKGAYGVLFKRLMDVWLLNPSLEFEELLKQEIGLNKNTFTIQDWQYYIINMNASALMKAFSEMRLDGRYVYTEPDGHSYFLRSRTSRSLNRYEFLTTYLTYEKSILEEGIESSDKPISTIDKLGAHVEFKKPDGQTIRLSVANKGLYKIEQAPSANDKMTTLCEGIDIKAVEIKLQELGIIKHL